jgi:hypothetical protein
MINTLVLTSPLFTSKDDDAYSYTKRILRHFSLARIDYSHGTERTAAKSDRTRYTAAFDYPLHKRIA